MRHFRLIAWCGVFSVVGCKGPVASGEGGLRVQSFPVNVAVAMQPYTYRPVLSNPGMATWTLTSAPDGATIDSNGIVNWTPTLEQGGAQKFTVHGDLGSNSVDQSFTVSVAAIGTPTEKSVDPQDPHGGTVRIDGPASPIYGAGLQLPPGALPGNDPINLSVAPITGVSLPAAARLANLDAAEVKAVEFGPNGLAFPKPVKVTLPVPKSLAKSGGKFKLQDGTVTKFAVQSLDLKTGKWSKVKNAKFDPGTGTVTAETLHFCTFVALPDVPTAEVAMNSGSSACSDALIVGAPLFSTFDKIPADQINGYDATADGAAATFADLLKNLPDGNALQIYTTLSGSSGDGQVSRSGWILAAAAKNGDKYEVSVRTNLHPNDQYLTIPESLAADDPELISWLDGSRPLVVMSGLGKADSGVHMHAEVSLYYVDAYDATQAPPQVANTFGSDDSDVTKLDAMTDDRDCAGGPEKYNPKPAGDEPPLLFADPDGQQHGVTDKTINLGVSTGGETPTYTWSADDSSVKVEPSAAGANAAITPSMPGFFGIDVTATRGSATASYHWDLLVDSAEMAMMMPAPTVQIAATAQQIQVGETAYLYAIGQGTYLTYQWSGSSGLSADNGDYVVFEAPSMPGDYTIKCVANDGVQDSAPDTLVISVTPKGNHDPYAPEVNLEDSLFGEDWTPGTPRTVNIHINGGDADEDDQGKLRFEITPAPSMLANQADPGMDITYTLQVSPSKDGDSENAVFVTRKPGVYIFFVKAIDPQGAESYPVQIDISVFEPVPEGAVDNDGDGYAAGADSDCDDNDSTVWPGAAEVCDGKRHSCDGKEFSMDDCDKDGDGWSTHDGDCDDTDPAIYPGAPEYCDGKVNDCNAPMAEAADAAFGAGEPCTFGVGACMGTGKTVCAAGGMSVACDATLGEPTTETCDDLDNDCDGIVDNVEGMAGGNDISSCGGCGTVCTAPANMLASCEGGCIYACNDGFFDVDNDPANGCECQATGEEICDGIDNDCNGLIDDMADESFYHAAMNTVGYGQCQAGYRSCVVGAWVISQDEALPDYQESCDGLDNNCDGNVDEGFDFLNDAQNCGGCNVDCGAEPCMGGVCAEPPMTDGHGGFVCDTGLTLCTPPEGEMAQPFCSDLGNTANCGECFKACPGGFSCAQGDNGALDCVEVTVTCPDGQDACADESGWKSCTYLDQDNHCGKCETVCDDASVCTIADDGTASCVKADAPPIVCTGEGETACGTNLFDGYCSLLDEPTNCGGCGNACPPDWPCAEDKDTGKHFCQAPENMTGPPTCWQGTDACLDHGGVWYCADLTSDPFNCGACGAGCPDTWTCEPGNDNTPNCTAPAGHEHDMVTCPTEGDTWCPDQGWCSSLGDTENCGACGVTCPDGTFCDSGDRAGAICKAIDVNNLDCKDLIKCGDICSDLLDLDNCGWCGNTCMIGQTCGKDGQGNIFCQGEGVCAADETTCPGANGRSSCSKLDNEFNCGDCGVACPGGWICQLNMMSGKHECQGDTVPTCDGGGFWCAEQQQCSFLNEPMNCGSCGNACPDGLVCDTSAAPAFCKSSGNTPPTCGDGQKACPLQNGGFTCAVTDSDNNNCGDCGVKCGPGKTCDTGLCSASVRIVSFPITVAQVGEDYLYQLLLSKPSTVTWSLSGGPAGATLDQDGQLKWKPNADQSGSQFFSLHGNVGGVPLDQSFEVIVSDVGAAVTDSVDPNDSSGGYVQVTGQGSPIFGAAVRVPAGALPGDQKIDISVAPATDVAMPSEAQIAGVNGSDLLPVEYGPTGLSFQKPVTLTLPVSYNLAMGRSDFDVLTLDYHSGSWSKLDGPTFDRAAGVVHVTTTHFSTYVVVPVAHAITLQIGKGGNACADALVISGHLSTSPQNVPARVVNGYAGGAHSLGEVVGSLPDGQAIQVYSEFRGFALDGSVPISAWILTAATHVGGNYVVDVRSSNHADDFLNVPNPIAPSDLLGWLDGSRVYALVPSVASAVASGAAVEASVSFYVVSGADATSVPATPTNAFASERVEVKGADLPLVPDDNDCDGAPAASDPQPASEVPPLITADPPETSLLAAVGDTITFKVTNMGAPASYSFIGSDPEIAVWQTGDGEASASANKPGLYQVTVVATRGNATASFQWSIVAVPQNLAPPPPVVNIGASAQQVQVGEEVSLYANGDGHDLSYTWTGPGLSNDSGPTVFFKSDAPGDYTVQCVASDGLHDSSPAEFTISVLPRGNHPPMEPYWTLIDDDHGQGNPWPTGSLRTLHLTVASSDVDESDVGHLTFTLTPDPNGDTDYQLSTAASDGTQENVTLSTRVAGTYRFWIVAHDLHGADSDALLLELPLYPPPKSNIDDDGDGFTRDIDCDDHDPTVHPGAHEDCDGKRHSCDGKPYDILDCDADGDDFTPGHPGDDPETRDCDDDNAAVHPGAPELCDGVVNDCSAPMGTAPDAMYDVGSACQVGMGECVAHGHTVCDQSQHATVCDAVPGQPQTDVCDMKDNDCDGIFDNVDPQSLKMDVNNCGTCNLHCQASAHSVATCINGGCSSECAQGYLDANHNPADGCECQFSGQEICDGFDNDCNGLIDDNIANQPFYDGANGTKDVGLCRAGEKRCENGMFVTMAAEILPTSEVCDGMDNDCDGQADDGFNFATDPRNCGGCHVDCGQEACENGVCHQHPTCGQGETTCTNAQGTDYCSLLQSMDDCGSCGNKCAMGEFCDLSGGYGICQPVPTDDGGSDASMNDGGDGGYPDGGYPDGETDG